MLEMAKKTSASTDANDLPPHAHSSVARAYSSMVQGKHGTPQSVLVSGESGAGKTETIKLCMAALANISRSTGSTTEAALESGLLLEAFGNAMTVYNHNSSRFGKWCALLAPFCRAAERLSPIPVLNQCSNSAVRAQARLPPRLYLGSTSAPQRLPAASNLLLGSNPRLPPRGRCSLHFGADAKISSGVIQSYLLEQSRIVSAPSGERNYHIFYYMLAGMPEPLRSQLYLCAQPAGPP